MARRRTPSVTPPASPPNSYGAMMYEVDNLPVPPRSAGERAAEVSLSQRMRSMADELRTRNLANGLALAQQAAAHQGQLVDVFAEIGRRYGHLLNNKGKLHMPSRGRVTSRADLVEVLSDVAKATGGSCPGKARTTFRVIEGGAD